MTNKVFCVLLKQDEVGLDNPPYPGELGQKIFENVSRRAWNMWLDHQTMLINEYRLSLADSKAREFLAKEMEKFFFGQGSDKPEGFVAPEE